MSRYSIVLNSGKDRQRAVSTIAAAPDGTRVEIKAVKRSLPQNDRMWAMLTEIAQQIPWHGTKLRPDDWKDIFLDGLRLEQTLVPNLDGSGFVSLRRSSSDLSKDEMSDLLELIAAWGAHHGVKFHDTAEAA